MALYTESRLLRLSAGTLDSLRRAAIRRGVSDAQIVRDAIRAYLDRLERQRGDGEGARR